MMVVPYAMTLEDATIMQAKIIEQVGCAQVVEFLIDHLAANADTGFEHRMRTHLEAFMDKELGTRV